MGRSFGNPVFFGERVVAHSKLSVFPQEFSYSVLKFVFVLPTRLLHLAQPSAVVRAVGPVVITPIKRQPCRAFAHIVQKVFEIFPALTNNNTAPAVPSPFGVFRVCASLPHFLPRLIRRAFVRHPMGSVNRCGLLHSQTPTRFCSSASKFQRVDGGFFAALTTTNPNCAGLLFLVASLEHEQPTKSQPSQINKFSHIHPYVGARTETLYTKKPPKPLDADQLWVILSGILGIAGFRSVEKVTGVARQ